MAKVAVVQEEVFGWMVFDDDCYTRDVEIPDDLYSRWQAATAELEKVEGEIVEIGKRVHPWD